MGLGLLRVNLTLRAALDGEDILRGADWGELWARATSDAR